MPAYSQSTIRMRDAVVDEVGVEQVVVARPERDRRGEERELDASADRGRQLVFRRDRDAARLGQGPVRLDDAQRDEQAGNGRAVVDPTERVRDASQRLGLVDGLVAHG